MKLNAKSDYIFLAIVYFYLAFALIIVLYPLIFVASASISDPAAVNQGKVIILPQNITFEGYDRIFKNPDILHGYINTVLYTVFGTLIALFTTFTAAYTLTQKDFIGKKFFILFFTFTMFFGGGLIPTYLLIKDLHLLHTPWVILLLGAGSMWNIVLVRTYISSSIPVELQEAAFIDGASHFKLFASVILPLSGPIIAVMTLFFAVGKWNEYFNAMIYLNDRKMYPLQLILREILITSEISAYSLQDAKGNLLSMAEQAKIAEVIKYAVIIVASAPLLIAYPFVQRYFVKGIMVGSLKG